MLINFEQFAAKQQRTISSTTSDQYLPDLAVLNNRQQLHVPEPKDEAHYWEMKRSTPARIGVWRCGARPLTQTMLKFRADHALAQDSVLGMVPDRFAADLDLLPLQTQVNNKEEYLTRPDLGRKLSPASKTILLEKAKKNCQVQIVVSDGLSSKAVLANIPDLLPALLQGLFQYGLTVGTPVFVKFGRVACMDDIGHIVNTESLVILIGERPGLGSAESLSAYLAYRPHQGMLESERSVISNIHLRGIPPLEAGAHLASVIQQIVTARKCGVSI